MVLQDIKIINCCCISWSGFFSIVASVALALSIAALNQLNEMSETASSLDGMFTKQIEKMSTQFSGSMLNDISNSCGDLNNCTIDLMISGNCINLPKINGEPCKSICYKDSNDLKCIMGECMGGKECKGICGKNQINLPKNSDQVIDICPSFQLFDPKTNNAIKKDVECLGGICLYSHKITKQNYDLTNRIGLKFYENICLSYLNKKNVYSNCLETTVTKDETNDNIYCSYYFKCVNVLV